MAQSQIANLNTPELGPKPSDLQISDDELRESIEANQLRLMKQRGSDLTIFSPRASFMAHHIGDFNTSATWAAICNELCYRVSRSCSRALHRRGDAAAVAGRRSRKLHPGTGKMRQGIRLGRHQSEPDPSGGHWTAPPLSDRSWYPIYEKMVEYDIPAMIHVSTSCNACFHTTGAHYLNADTTAFMQCLTSDLFTTSRPEIRHPARRRRRALSLGPFPRPGAGNEEATC
jgi:4-oxalmesaconate hydratase